MVGDRRLPHFDQTRPKSLRSQALRRHASAFQHEKQLVRKRLRPSNSGSSTQVNQPPTLSRLEFLDHAPRRMILFRQLHRGIGQRAAPFIAVGHMARHVRAFIQRQRERRTVERATPDRRKVM